MSVFQLACSILVKSNLVVYLGKLKLIWNVGCGILSVGSGLMGCDFCLEIDIDGGKLLCFTFTLARVFLYKILNYFAWSSDLSIFYDDNLMVMSLNIVTQDCLGKLLLMISSVCEILQAVFALRF